MTDDSDPSVNEAALHAAFRELLGPLPSQAPSGRATARVDRWGAPADASRPSALSSSALAGTHESIDCTPRGVSTLTRDEPQRLTLFFTREGSGPRYIYRVQTPAGEFEQAFSLGGLKCLISRVADECFPNGTTTTTGQKLSENALSAVMSKQSTESPGSFGAIKKAWVLTDGVSWYYPGEL